MTPNDADRSGFSRQRLTRAAAASFALHMLLFGGLTVSKLDLAIRPSDSPAAREPKRPTRPAADFRLQVSRSASAKQPAHERPLEVPVKPAAVKPVDRREQPTERMIAAESPQLEEPPTEVTVSQPQFEPVRPRDTAAPPLQIDSPQRLSEAAPAETAATAALAPAAATVETAAAASPSPAATIPRESRSTGPVAARWRPREAALLERLTARVPDASALSARPTPTAAVPSSSAGSLRRQSPAAAAAGTTRAEAIAPPAAAEMPAVAALTPSAREPARRSSLRGAATRPAAAVNLAAAASDVPPLPATSLAATRVVSRSAASRAVLVPESPAGLAGSRSPLARRSAATATTAAAGGSAPGIEMPAIAAVSGQPASGGDSGRAASGGSETGRGDRLGPALLERGRRGATGRSALTAARGLTGAGAPL